MSRDPSPLANVCETSQVISVSFKKPSARYIDEFIRLKCAPDLLAARIYPNAKEITESMAAFDAARKAVGAEALGDKEWLMVDVGCGSTPRNAALFAFRTNWMCLAVDPQLRLSRYPEIDRMHCHKLQIEQMVPHVLFRKPTKIMAVAVHAHVRLPAIMDMLAKVGRSLLEKNRPMLKRVVLVAIPCCIEQILPEEPKKQIVDWGIWSPKRTVKVWDFNKEDRQ